VAPAEVPYTNIDGSVGTTVLGTSDINNINNVNLIVSDSNTQILPPAAFISSPQTDLDTLTNNLLMQQSVSVANNPILTMVPEQQTVMLQNLQQTQLQAAGDFQGIPPGLSSSLILTPTVMSQVQPTPTIQAINLSDGLVTTNISSALESIIMTPAIQTNPEALQTFNSLTGNVPIAAAGNLTIPLQQTSSYLPSTITLDPNLLKKQNITIDPTLLAQNVQLQPTTTVTVPSSNQCILVDGNLVALAQGGLPVQQVLVSADMLTNQSVMVNNLPQTVNTVPVNQVLQQQLLQRMQHQVPTAHEKLQTVLKTPTKTVKLAKQQTVIGSGHGSAKKTKTIQSISTLSPESSVFNQVKSSKGTTPLATNSGKNVIITKKTINVIKKSEGQVIPMKPTSVEQVQPGVFKFQLKKVNSLEAAALMQSSSVTTSTSLTDLFQSGISRGGAPNLQKIGRTAIKMSTNATSSSNTSATSSSSGVTIKTANLPKDMLSKLKDLNRFPTVKVSSPSKFVNTSTFSKEVKRTTTNPQQLTTKKVVLQTISSKTPLPVVKISGKSTDPSATSLNTEASRNIPAKPVQPNNIKIDGKSTNIQVSQSAKASRYIITKPVPANKMNTLSSTKLVSKDSISKQLKAAGESSVTKKVTSIPKCLQNLMPCKVSVTDASTTKQAVQTSSLSPKQVVKAVTNTNVVKDKAAVAILDQLNGNSKHVVKRCNWNDDKISGDAVVVTDSDLMCEERILMSPTDLQMKRGSSSESKRPAVVVVTSSTKAAKAAPNVRELKFPRFEKGLPILEKAKEMLKKAKTASSSSIVVPTLVSQSVPARDLSPREKSEMENMREAITSSHVGLQEVNMRELAVQEIEKQLKRFSTTNKKSDGSTKDEKVSGNKDAANNSKHAKRVISPNSTNDQQKKPDEKADNLNSTDKNIDLKRKNSPPSGSNPDQPTEKKTKVGGDKPTAKSDSRKTAKKRKSQSIILDENRKRERPKKFDDFVLADKPKREKEKKPKKFFFPKEDSVTDKTRPPGEDARPDNGEESDICDLKSSADEQENESENESTNNEPKPKSRNRDTGDENPGDNKPVAPKSSTNKKQSQKQQQATKKNTKKLKKRKQKKSAAIAFELETLPEHLKTKSKSKTEDTVLDLAKVKLKSSFAETSFVLSDVVENKTFKLLERKNWACTLCGHPGNLGSLDVLFGPYKINVRRRNTDSSKKNKSISAPSENDDPQHQQQMSVWLHRDCAVWTSNICLSNQTLCGLGESLDEAATTVCCVSFPMYYLFIKPT